MTQELRQDLPIDAGEERPHGRHDPCLHSQPHYIEKYLDGAMMLIFLSYS